LRNLDHRVLGFVRQRQRSATAARILGFCAAAAGSEAATGFCMEATVESAAVAGFCVAAATGICYGGGFVRQLQGSAAAATRDI
jgi:hypothetical protein